MPPPVPFQSLSQEKLPDKIEQSQSFYPTIALLLFPSFSSLRSRELMAPGETWAMLSLEMLSLFSASSAVVLKQHLVASKRLRFTLFVELVNVYTPGGASISERWDQQKAFRLNHLCWLCLETRTPVSVLISLFYFSLLQVIATEALPRSCQRVSTKDGRADSSSSRRNELARLVGQAGEHMEDL